MTQEIVRAGSSSSAQAGDRAPLPGLPPGGEALLAMQRTAGNRAAVAAMRGPRTLARCQGGVCTCGGACKKRRPGEVTGRQL
jgi:hypothetical protein